MHQNCILNFKHFPDVVSLDSHPLGDMPHTAAYPLVGASPGAVQTLGKGGIERRTGRLFSIWHLRLRYSLHTPHVSILRSTSLSCNISHISTPRSVSLFGCRDILAKLSNDEALHYGRKVRLIVRRLRTEIIDVNEEMKALNRWTISRCGNINL